MVDGETHISPSRRMAQSRLRFVFYWREAERQRRSVTQPRVGWSRRSETKADASLPWADGWNTFGVS
jgi:hypothetical protein